MTTLLLARHGETEWNAARRIQGQMNSHLTERGRQQADTLAARLATQRIDAIYSSDLVRALDTAAPIAAAHGLDVRSTEALRERSFGAWEGLTSEEVAEQYPEAHQRWRVGQENIEGDIHESVGGESWAAVSARIAALLETVLAEWTDPEQTILFVGHGGSLRAAVVHALAAPLPTLLRLHFDNASLSVLSYPPGRSPRVLKLNDTSHVEKAGL